MSMSYLVTQNALNVRVKWIIDLHYQKNLTLPNFDIKIDKEMFKYTIFYYLVKYNLNIILSLAGSNEETY